MSSPLVTMSPLQLPPAEPQPSPPYPLQERWEASAAARRDERDRPPRQETDANERKRSADGSEAPPPAIGLAVPVLTQTGALAWAAGRAQRAAAAAAAELTAHQLANATTSTAVGSRGGTLLNVAAVASATAQATAADARAVPTATADAASSAALVMVSSTTSSTMMGATTAVASTTQRPGMPVADGTPPAGGQGAPAGAGRSAAPEPGRRDPAGAGISAAPPSPSVPTTAPASASASTSTPRPAADARAFAFVAQAASAATPAGSSTTLSVPMSRLGDGQHVLASWPHGIQGSHVQLRPSSALGHRVLSEALEATSGSDAGPWIVEASSRGDDDGQRRERSSPAPWEDD